MGGGGMTLLSLIFRTLRSRWAASLAVILGMAVATAVIIGALVLGSSVTGTLRAQATAAYQNTPQVIYSSTHFFTEELAQRLPYRGIPGILTKGRVFRESPAGETLASASNTQIIALEPSKAEVTVDPQHLLLNETLASTLNDPAFNAEIFLTLPRTLDSATTAFTSSSRTDQLATLRLKRIWREADHNAFVNYFQLYPAQRAPRTAWLRLPEIQAAMQEPHRINLILLSPPESFYFGQAANRIPPPLPVALHNAMTLDDYGLSFTPGPEGSQQMILQARNGYLNAALASKAQAVAQELRKEMLPAAQIISTNLLTEVSLKTQNPDRAIPTIHYALAAGISSGGDAEISSSWALKTNEVALNQWTIGQLQEQSGTPVKLGDQITFRFLERQPNGELRNSEPVGPLTIARILPMSGLGADPTLTPTFKGFTDAATVHDWTPPAGFPFDPKLVTPADEEYWNQHRAAPKIFISLTLARQLWGAHSEKEATSEISSIRVPAALAATFKQALLAKLQPADVGISIRNLADEHLAAASSPTDFSTLFLALSMFLLAVALLLVLLLFRLLIEQQAPRIGLLLALGFTPGRIWRLMLLQGAMLAGLGTLMGLPLGLAYAGAMIHGLTTWWLPALGTPNLTLHFSWPPLLIGGGVGFVMAMAVILWALRILRRYTAIDLLVHRARYAGFTAHEKRQGRTRWFVLLAAWVGLAILLILQLAGQLSPTLGYFLIGSLTLVAVLETLAYRFLSRRQHSNSLSLWSLAWRNTTRHPTRTQLTLWLIAASVFLLITLAAFQAPATTTTANALILTVDQPLRADLNTSVGRKLLGITNPNDPLWSRAKFLGFWVQEGQDISCRNLTKPTTPRVLGIPTETLAACYPSEPLQTTLKLLNTPTADQTVPCAADAETATYNLHAAIGKPGKDRIPIPDHTGQTQQLKLTTLLPPPLHVFQGELLISQPNFTQLFGKPAGPALFLIEAPTSDLPTLRRELQQQLADYSVTLETTAERLASYQAIANTYLATFQTLGNLALFLGTLGLAIVLLRNLLERQNELALLLMLGFSPTRRFILILLENSLLLTTGMLLGLLCALPALIPAWGQVHLLNLLFPMAVILLSGLATLALITYLGSAKITQLTPAE